MGGLFLLFKEKINVCVTTLCLIQNVFYFFFIYEWRSKLGRRRGPGVCIRQERLVEARRRKKI